MGTEPTVQNFDRQAYVGVRAEVTMQTIATVAERIGELVGIVAASGIEITDAPFLRYHRFLPGEVLDLEAGVPCARVPDGLPADADAHAVPAGRYAVVTHHGHPDGLFDATSEMLRWADAEGLRWDRSESADRDEWACRLEVYRTHPAEQPDPHHWDTDLRFKLAD